MAQEQIIIPSYDGMFADKMDWQEDRLDNFAKISDLRTPIQIMTGNRTTQSNIHADGDTLIWKRLGSHFSKDSETPLSEHNLNLSFNRGEVIINQHPLSESLKQNNVIDPKKYISSVNRLVRQELLALLLEEKNFQLGISAAYLAIDSVFILGNLGLAIGFGSGELLSWFPADTSREIVIKSAVQVVESGLFLSASAIGALRTHNKILDSRNSNNPYFHSGNDYYNPVLHLSGFLNGALFLNTFGRELVKYKTEK